MSHLSGGIIIDFAGDVMETKIPGTPVKIRDCFSVCVGFGLGYLLFG